MKIVVGLMLLLMPALSGYAAEDRQKLEDALFTEDSGNTTPAITPNPVLVMTPDTKTVAFSGEITSAFIDQISNSQNADYLYTYTVGDIYLDARLPQNAKVFANLEAIYLSQGQITNVALHELFFDFNLAQAVYFRTGKQVLQWGRCYLWNPTDLINVERPRFIRKIGTREGAYGLKWHVPFGTKLNIYGFVDTGTAMDSGQVANAVKTEILVGNFEIAFSGWGKKGFDPVWGMDFSTRILGIDTLGEVSVTQGDNQTRARIRDGQLVVVTYDDSWTPRASLDFSRSFTVGDFKDRLTIMLEGYYDHAGYTENVLADTTDYPFSQPVILSGTQTPAFHGTQRDFINGNHLYAPNYFSRSYVALFTTFGRFIFTDMQLTLNYIQNLVDSSSLLSAGVTYTELNSFTVGLLANFCLGKPDTEYTSAGSKVDLQLTFGIAF